MAENPKHVADHGDEGNAVDPADHLDLVDNLHFERPRRFVRVPVAWVGVTAALISVVTVLLVLRGADDRDPKADGDGPQLSPHCSAFVDLAANSAPDRVREAVGRDQVDTVNEKTRKQLADAADGIRSLAVEKGVDEDLSRSLLSAAIAYDAVIAAINQGEAQILTDALDTRDVVVAAVEQACNA